MILQLHCCSYNYSVITVTIWQHCVLLPTSFQHVPSQTRQAPATPSSTSPASQWEEVDFEEQQLRQKLDEMADNISNHSLTSDDEEEEDEDESHGPPEEAKPSRIPTRPTSRASIVASILEEEQTDAEKVQQFILELCVKRKRNVVARKIVKDLETAHLDH